ncbi:MAG: hypothetical protein AABZ24_09520, partial [Nitrospirota bacterium]
WEAPPPEPQETLRWCSAQSEHVSQGEEENQVWSVEWFSAGEVRLHLPIGLETVQEADLRGGEKTADL